MLVNWMRLLSQGTRGALVARSTLHIARQNHLYSLVPYQRGFRLVPTPITAASARNRAMEAAAGGTVLAGNSTDVLPGLPATSGRWTALNVTREELTLDHCLPTGQSFRWQQLGPGHHVGVIGPRLVEVRQDDQGCYYQVLARSPGTDPAEDEGALRDYFNLPRASGPGASEGVSLSELSQQWAQACSRYAHVCPHIPGARMLRQPPLECLLQFICSSNNHISRIHGMVQRLCQAYGTPLVPEQPALAAADSTDSVPHSVAADSDRQGPSDSTDSQLTGKKRPRKRSRSPRRDVAATTALLQADGSQQGNGGAEAGSVAGQETTSVTTHYSFPTLEQLSKATEEELRAAGFGYRAKFIVGTVETLNSKPGGGDQWLMGLRSVSYAEASAALEELPGVGPKVAACVCLFSLDKHDAIPVDTHVWQIATKYYGVKSKSLTKKVHGEVQEAFVKRFGPFAGWAHNALFISELAQHKQRIPPWRD